jgi:hypothetical protein
LIDVRRLALMKPGALLINVARARIVDANALYAALKDGHLGGDRARPAARGVIIDRERPVGGGSKRLKSGEKERRALPERDAASTAGGASGLWSGHEDRLEAYRGPITRARYRASGHEIKSGGQGGRRRSARS